MTYVTIYFTIGGLCAIAAYWAQVYEAVENRADREGKKFAPDSITLAMLVVCLFLWPLAALLGIYQVVRYYLTRRR